MSVTWRDRGQRERSAEQGENVIPVNTLPHNQTLSPEAAYGTILGKSVGNNDYSSTMTSGTSAAVSLTTTQKTAYVTFFYEQAGSFTGDFDVLPSTISYKNNFTLHPKDFQLNGCT